MCVCVLFYSLHTDIPVFGRRYINISILLLSLLLLLCFVICARGYGRAFRARRPSPPPPAEHTHLLPGQSARADYGGGGGGRLRARVPLTPSNRRADPMTVIRLHACPFFPSHGGAFTSVDTVKSGRLVKTVKSRYGGGF